jgi:large subunit ribosomal protein L31
MVDRSARVNASEGNMDMSDKDPEYRDVVFRDRTADFAFLTRSTAKSDQTIEWNDGNTYPVVDVDISSASHPFWTGRQRPVGSATQVEKFRAKYRRADESKHGPERRHG